jgi:hypothetical protein
MILYQWYYIFQCLIITMRNGIATQWLLNSQKWPKKPKIWCRQQLDEGSDCEEKTKGCVTYVTMFRGLLSNYCVSIPLLKRMMEKYQLTVVYMQLEKVNNDETWLQHFCVNNSLKIKVHKSRLYCIHFTAV